MRSNKASQTHEIGCGCITVYSYHLSGSPCRGTSPKKFCKDASWQEISLSRQSVSRQWPAVCAGPVAGRVRGCGHPRSMPCAGPETKNAEAPGSFRRGSAARGMVPPVVAAVMDRDGLVVPVAGFRAGRHMGRRRRLAGLGPVRRWRRLPVMARRWRVVIPGVIVMHTACPQDEEPGEQDQGQDMQEPDKSGMRTHRHSLVPSRIAPPAKEQKRPRA